MEKVVLEVVKICAVGCDKNFITIRLGHRMVTFFTIDRDLNNFPLIEVNL